MFDRRWRARWAASTMAMLLGAATVGTGSVGAWVPAPAGSLTATDSLDLAPALDPSGRFIGAPGLTGSVDLGGWAFVSDLASGEPPRFALAVGSDRPARQRARRARPAGVANWSAVGPSGGESQLEHPVLALRAKKNFLYLGGDFFNLPDDDHADGLAEWDGAAYAAVGDENNILDNSVFAIAVDGPDLYVGGTFQNADDLPTADRIAKWNGTTEEWESLGGSLNAAVNAIAVIGDDVFVGGDFTGAGGISTADYIARYDGSWHNLGSHAGDGALSDHVKALAVSGSDLYVGGLFTNADGDDRIDYVARWDGAWNRLGADAGDGVLTGEVRALLVSGLDLYVGGSFENVLGDDTIDHVARWRNGAWSGLGSNGGDGALGSDVHALAKAGRDIYVAGNFINAAGNALADRVARWDGSSWHSLGSNGSGNGAIGDTVYAVAVFQGRLYVGGVFEGAANIDEADYLASFALATSYVPDGKVRVVVDGTYKGNDIYNTGAKNQKVTESGARGDVLVYQVAAENDSPTSTDSFRFVTSDISPDHFRIRYFQGSLNITEAVEDGSYVTNPTAKGNERTIKIKIKIKHSAPANATVTRKITISSVEDPTRVDAVKVTAQR